MKVAKLGKAPSKRRELSLDKGRISDAVHQAVCEVTDSDGSGQCIYYAHAGQGLLRWLGIESYVQAGRHAVVVHGDYCIGTGEAVSVIGGDFHCWLSRPLRPVTGIEYRGPMEYVDFTARHYQWYTRGFSWTREEPPDYLWTVDPADWVRCEVDRAQTDFANDPENLGVDVICDLWRTAIRHYGSR